MATSCQKATTWSGVDIHLTKQRAIKISYTHGHADWCECKYAWEHARLYNNNIKTEAKSARGGKTCLTKGNATDWYK